MAINLKLLISQLRMERFNSRIIYGDAGIGKSAYLKKFIDKTADLKIGYFSLLHEYGAMQSAEPIIHFNPSRFISWSLSVVPGSSEDGWDAKIIDNFDFLFNYWSTSQKEEFLKQVEKFIEKPVTPIPTLFVLHNDPLIENNLEKNFIIRFSELETLNEY